MDVLLVDLNAATITGLVGTASNRLHEVDDQVLADTDEGDRYEAVVTHVYSDRSVLIQLDYSTCVEKEDR